MNLDDARLIWDVAVEAWQATPTEAHLSLAVLAALLVVDARTRKDPGTAANQRTEPVEVKRKTNSPLLLRWKWRAAPPRDLMRIDGLEINRDRSPHCLWDGTTGDGKSTAVAMTRLDGARPALCATPDISDPLIGQIARIGGRRWTACESREPIDFLSGEPEVIAELLTDVFPSGGVGTWLRVAREAITKILRTFDVQGIARTLRSIADALYVMAQNDRELKTACSNWIDRLYDAATQFRDCIADHGFSIAALLKHGISVLIDIDGFVHPKINADLVAFVLARARLVALQIPSGFRLIFEEADQLKERILLAKPFTDAGRRRNITVDMLVHDESAVPDLINCNIATHVYWPQGLKASQRTAADRLAIDYRKLDYANMADYTAWVNHRNITRLVKFPRPPRTTNPRPSYVLYPTGTPTPPPKRTPYGPERRRVEVTELPLPREGTPQLPFPRLEVQEVLSKIDRTCGDCWLWTGLQDRDGYGLQRWAYPDPNKPRNNRPAHQVVWEIVNGRWFPRNDNGKSWDWDHGRRACPRHCVSPYHGEPVSNEKGNNENSRRRWRVRGVGSAAD